ncbi:MAG: hypothetical protein JAY60_19655 [Candidatus Thiodiazotropha weberae]|nr:hypothetical protein [Candidatus Thiodiazotropha weberae]
MPTVADLSMSQYYASKKDPERHARHLRLADSQKLPIETVARNEQEVEQKERRSQLDFTSYLDTNPGLAEYLSNKDNAAVSADDIDPLKGIEDTLKTRSFGDYIQDYSIDLFGKGSVNFAESLYGISQYAIGNTARAVMNLTPFGRENPELADALTNELMGELSKKHADIGFKPGESKQIMSGLQSKERQESDAEVAQADGFFGTLDALIENPDSLTGTVAESVLSMIGPVAAARRLSMAMLAKNGLKPGSKEATEFLARNEVKAKLTTVAGLAEGAMAGGSTMHQSLEKGADFGKASTAALGTVATTAAITKLSSKFLPDAEVELATAGGKSQSLQQGLSQIGKSIVKEGALEEMPQSGFEQVWQNFALDMPLLDGVGESMATGLLTGSAMGGGMSTASTSINALTRVTEDSMNEVVESSFDQQKIDQIITYAQSSKTSERSPAQWKEYLHSVGSDQSIYMDAEAARAIPGLPVTIKEQINVTDADIEIPIHEFAEEIIKDEALLEQVRPHIKLRPEASTATELEQGHSSEIESLVQKAMQSKQDLTEAQQIYEEVKDQLIATDRMSESTAATAAKLIPAYVTTTAKRYKKSVGEIYEQMGLKIVGPDANIEEEMRTFHQERVSKVQELLDCLGG